MSLRPVIIYMAAKCGLGHAGMQMASPWKAHHRIGGLLEGLQRVASLLGLAIEEEEEGCPEF